MNKLPFTADFLNLQQVSRSMGEDNDCAVKAVAIVTGLSYAEAHKRLAAKGRKARHGTPMHMILAAVREAGKNITTVQQTSITHLYPGKHASKLHVTSYQPARFPKAWKNGKTYLMLTRGHILAVVDGTVHDWSIGRSLDCITLYEIN